MPQMINIYVTVRAVSCSWGWKPASIIAGTILETACLRIRSWNKTRIGWIRVQGDLDQNDSEHRWVLGAGLMKGNGQMAEGQMGQL